jgi:hypothetical protein
LQTGNVAAAPKTPPMPELILLCSAAAGDRATTTGAIDAQLADPQALRRVLDGGAFARAFSRDLKTSDSSDDALVPRELPEERWWRERLGIPDTDSIQAFAALAHGMALPCWRLTPTHVEIGLDQARLADPAEVALSAEESASLAAEAAPIFADYGIALQAPSPRAWFVTGDLGIDPETRSWTMVAGRNVDAYLPRGEQSRRWRKLLNEIQMTWFAGEANRARESRGAPVVNMLWLDGRAGTTLAPLSASIVSRDDALAGLAIASGARAIDPGAAMPGADALRELADAGDVVVDLAGWVQARRQGDPLAWLDAWQDFDAWIARIGVDRGVPAGFDGVRAVLTGERRRLELQRRVSPWWRVRRRIDPIGLL